jgi:hypothetical protein
VPAGFAPVALASNVPFPAGSRLIHAGFGQSTTAVNDRGVLRFGRGRLLNLLSNPARYVAQGAPASICSGDSGGPDYLPVEGGRLIQVGVHVSGGCDLGASSTSTDVRAHLDWIRSVGATPVVD